MARTIEPVDSDSEIRSFKITDNLFADRGAYIDVTANDVVLTITTREGFTDSGQIVISADDIEALAAIVETLQELGVISG